MSVSCSFIKLSNTLVFPDLEAPIFSILYEWSGIYGHVLLWFLLLSFVTASKLQHLNIQLEASKSSNEDFFKELLNEMKGFKYKITVKVLLNKY